jgi:peroxiredoxin Q/BCP
MALKIGDEIPRYLGKNQDGKAINSSDYREKKLVIYFYPKDNTPGCTAEACSFRDSYAVFRKKGYEILGVSTDGRKSHLEFIEKQHLPFDLITDTDKDLVEKFGVWGEKSMYGRKYMGIIRTTFLVDEHGIIKHIFQSDEINTSSHAEQVRSFSFEP